MVVFLITRTTPFFLSWTSFDIIIVGLGGNLREKEKRGSTPESLCFILPSYSIHQNIRILSPYDRGTSTQRHRTVYESPQYVQIDSDDSFIAFSCPSSLCFLTPSERRFVRSMTTGMRNHISSDKEALSLILGLFFAKIAILCV